MGAYILTDEQLRALGASASSQARRSVRLSAYYDAAAVNPRDRDWGHSLAAGFDDALFTGATRATTLARFRREVRNNPYLAGLSSKFPEAIGNTSLRSTTRDKDFNLAKDSLWFAYARAVTLTGDSLLQVERLVDSELLFAGELFVVKLANGLVQLIPSELCGGAPRADGRPRSPTAPRELNGIVYDPVGRPLAYRFGTVADGGAVKFTGEPGELVPAEHVLHVFDKDRIVMGRGLPWLLPSLATARDLYEITRSKTKQIKDANSISGFLEKQGAAEYLAGLNTAELPAEHVDAASGAEKSTAPADAQPAGPVQVELAPGTFIGLEPGEKANILMPKYEATDYKELIMIMLHAISSPVGLPVELWFSGLGDVNYSGFKGLGTQWNGRRRYIHGFLQDRLYAPWQAWRSLKWQAEGDLPANPDRDEHLVSFGWRRTPVLDEEKAAKTNETRLRSGEASHADIWTENGEFPEEVLGARREFWIKLQLAAGRLAPGTDLATVEVPLAFLLRGEIPGTPSSGAPAPSAAPRNPGSTEGEQSPAPDPATQAGDWSPSEHLTAAAPLT